MTGVQTCALPICFPVTILLFVLSGFLITRILVSEKGSESYFLNFYARRFLRIVPLYYLFLFGIFYVLREPVQFGFTYWTFLSNILVSRLGYFPSPSLDMAWSLAVEEQFYFVWPFIILLTNEKQLGRICKILFLAALALRLLFFFTHSNLLTNYVLLPTRMDSLAAGAWLAVSYRTLPPKFCTKAFWCLTPFTMAIFAVDVSHSAPLMQTLGFSFNALLSVFLIGSLIKNETAVFFAFFQNSFLKTLGKYSYGMYLFHVPVTHWIFQKGKIFWSVAPEKLGAGFPIQILFHAAALLGSLFKTVSFKNLDLKPVLQIEAVAEVARPPLNAFRFSKILAEPIPRKPSPGNWPHRKNALRVSR